MYIDFLLKVISDGENDPAIIWRNQIFTYRDLILAINEMRMHTEKNNIKKGMVVALRGDYSPLTIALLIVLIEKSCIIVPLTEGPNEEQLNQIAQVECLIKVSSSDIVEIERIQESSSNDFYTLLREKGRPGLVLFTSGTSGVPKAAVHDLPMLLEKFRQKRTALRTLNFLLFDHWGGLNTLFHILSNGGVVIATRDRTPDNICKLVEKHRIELLPASPTFLNLMLLSGAHEQSDMSSLKIISYGTEPMPESTLIRMEHDFPGVKLLQTYGLIELGVLRSKSENNNSLWVKVGGEGYKTRVIDGMLQIKAESAMMGYLNAPSPFTKDGYFITGDEVLQKGEYIKILGRRSQIINVGGEKVYPQEVENVILEMVNIAEVTVFGEKNPIMGNIVCAKIRPETEVSLKAFKNDVKKYCRERLASFKVPVKIRVVQEIQYGERFKKRR